MWPQRKEHSSESFGLFLARQLGLTLLLPERSRKWLIRKLTATQCSLCDKAREPLASNAKKSTNAGARVTDASGSSNDSSGSKRNSTESLQTHTSSTSSSMSSTSLPPSISSQPSIDRNPSLAKSSTTVPASGMLLNK